MVILIALSLLPYFKVTPLESDTQPYALFGLMLAIAVSCVQNKSLPIRPSSLILSVLLFLFGLPSGEYSATISLAVFPIAVDYFSRIDAKALSLGVRVAIVFMLVGVVLNIVAEDMLSSLVSNYRSSLFRGMNSFASEPSFLGLMGFAAAVISKSIGLNGIWLTLGGLVVLASGSATAILPFTMYLTLLFLKGRTLLLLPLFFTGLVLGLQYVATMDSRLGMLVSTAIVAPQSILLDESVSNRLIRSGGPLIEAYQDGFVPHGLAASFDINIAGLSDAAGYEVTRLSNVASFLGYGLGFACLPVIGWYLVRSKAQIELWFSLLVFSVVNISIATPYLWILFSLPWIEYRRWQHLTSSKANGYSRATAKQVVEG